MARLLTWWWIPFAIALAAVVGWETDWGDAIYPPVVIAQAPEAKPIVPALLPEYKETVGPEAYAEVVERPLFSPTRRPVPPPPPPEPPKQVMQTGQYQLTGTIQVGEKLYAFMRETKGGKGFRAGQGDVLAGGIRLAKVEPDRIVLTQYESEEEVKLQVSKSTRTTPVAQPAAMPGGIPGGTGIVGGVAQQAPNTLPQPSNIRLNEAQPQLSAPGQPQGAPFVPGSATLAPFVPGVSVAPRPESVDTPPRRRGALQ
ncbi:MAG: hypothetical protein ABI854_01590 [Betaproteobacteria bacterium]